VGASSTLTYALPLEQEESLQAIASEVGNTEETASNAETVTETAVEKDTTEDPSVVEEREASDKEKEKAGEESSLSTEALGGTDRAAGETLTPLSRSRRALADPPYYASEEEEKEDRRNKVLSVGVEFDNTLDVAGRDHMKVVREIPLKVNSYAVGIAGATYDYTQFRIQPKRVVEKKEGNNWTVYNLDYFTPGIYRYSYILEIVKGSSLYLAEGEINGEKKITAEAHIQGNFVNGVHNNSNSIAKIIPLETDSSVGRKYRLEGREFAVEKEETISKVYLKSNLDIYNIHAGDLMKRITLSLDKMELTDGTVVMNSDTNMPLLVNTMKDYPDNLQQYKVRLYSHKNEEGYIGAVFNITESKPYTVGLYHSYFFIRPNYQIGKYRFLVNNTNDDYGSGTQFYINNEFILFFVLQIFIYYIHYLIFIIITYNYIYTEIFINLILCRLHITSYSHHYSIFIHFSCPMKHLSGLSIRDICDRTGIYYIYIRSFSKLHATIACGLHKLLHSLCFICIDLTT